jgi:DNA glycosylase AlkZ-like
LELVERLVGLQAQVPQNPYVALWSRLEDFDPSELSTLIAERRAVRAQLMRSTIHLVSARDCLAFHPVTLPVRRRTFRNPWSGKLNGADVDEVVAAGLGLLAEQALTRTELSALLAERWPGADPLALAYAVTFHAPLVQVPPRGLWGSTGQARWAHAERWLQDALDPDPSPEAMVLRYLAAFGPATVADIRTWSGLTGLRGVVASLRPSLQAFRDEQGRELLDLADGALAAAETPAPPRFLPEYDNVLLSHADRSRVLSGLGPCLPFLQGGRGVGTLLVDGFYRANWIVTDEPGGATLTIDRFAPVASDPAGTADAIVAEGTGLLAFLAPDKSDRRVVFAPEP